MHSYSQRASWSFVPNKLSRLLEDKRNCGAKILDLTVSNPTVVLSYPNAAVQQALSAGAELRYAPDPFGIAAARTTVSDFYRQRGFEVSPTRIALTASTSEAYSLLFKLLCDPGDEVLIPAPSYPLFHYLAALESVRIVTYPLRYDGSWSIDFRSLREQISPRCRAIVIVNPNNPTGSFLKNWERDQLLEIALESQLAVIADEVFMDYSITADPQGLRTLIDADMPLSFSLNGLSKSACMPQMKLAWIVINAAGPELEAARERLEIILDTYLSVNTPVQLALPELLEIGAQLRAAVLARTHTNLGTAFDVLNASAATVLHTEGGWSCIIQLPRIMDEEEWVTRLLDQENVLLQPGFFFDMPSEAFAVASLITEPETFREGLARLHRLVTEVTRH